MTERERINIKVELLESIIKRCGERSEDYKPWVEGTLEAFLETISRKWAYLDEDVIE